MEIVSPQEFIEKPVIDIEVEFVGAPKMGWTVNDEPETDLQEVSPWLSFNVPLQSNVKPRVRIPMRNIAWYTVTRRIDRIPVKSMAGQAEMKKVGSTT